MPKDLVKPEVQTQIAEFNTADGANLVARLYAAQEPPSAVIVLCGATGVPQRFYKRFAEWVAAEKGMACLTFDYRDMGLSADQHLRHSHATMTDWGITDAEAARSYAKKLFPDTPLWVIGHSLGTMMIPMQKNVAQIDRIIGIASGTVHYTDHPWPYRALAMQFWFTIGPLATRLKGYMPGKSLGFGEDMPASAYWQWRKFCTDRDFFRNQIARTLPPWRTEHLPDQTRFFSLSDDALIPDVCVRRLARGFNHAPCTLIDPAQHGLGKVGHLDFFAKRNQALWPLIFAD